MREKKQKLRARALLRRESLPTSELCLWSHLIQERALRFFPYLSSRSVALYSPIGNEVATEEIRDHTLGAQKKLFYPKLGKGENWDLIQVESAEELRAGRYGILEPTGDKVMTEQDQTELVVFVPGLAFDLQGNRLGRGGGWYDRALELVGEGARVVALAYEFQVEKDLPAEGWDQRVHHIITERRVIDCRDIPSRSGGRPKFIMCKGGVTVGTQCVDWNWWILVRGSIGPVCFLVAQEAAPNPDGADAKYGGPHHRGG